MVVKIGKIFSYFFRKSSPTASKTMEQVSTSIVPKKPYLKPTITVKEVENLKFDSFLRNETFWYVFR